LRCCPSLGKSHTYSPLPLQKGQKAAGSIVIYIIQVEVKKYE
jgi:hypothetical protein